LHTNTIVPDIRNPESYDRYEFVANNPLKYVDPGGHCWGIASAIRGVPSYGTTCNNLDMALEIVSNPNSTASQKVAAGAYIAGEAAAHAALVVGVAGLACSAVVGCAKAVEAGLGIGTRACADGDCQNEAQAAAKTAESGLADLRAMLQEAGRGLKFEEWLQKRYGGEGNFWLGNIEYDNKVGKILWEAKSSDWNGFTADSQSFTDFQNQIGTAASRAAQNGYGYVLRLLNKPPQFIIDWLEKKGYDYVIEP
jgi:hypothetical protein